jgi:uncharacterized membrane-anchored protein
MVYEFIRGFDVSIWRFWLDQKWVMLATKSLLKGSKMYSSHNARRVCSFILLVHTSVNGHAFIRTHNVLSAVGHFAV